MTISDLLTNKTKVANGELSADGVVEDRSIKVKRITDIQGIERYRSRASAVSVICSLGHKGHEF